MHIWLYLCKEYGGTVTNVHSSEGAITDHFELKFDEPMIVNPREPRQIVFDHALGKLESSILQYPNDAIAHLTWPHFRPHRGPSAG